MRSRTIAVTKPRRLPLWFVAKIRPSLGGRFLLDREGVAAHIVPVRDRSGIVVDLVGWLPSDTSHWWSKEREIPILGARELAGAALAGMSIPLFPTPAAWVAGGGHGVCVLDWDIPLLSLFRDVRQISLAPLSREETAEAQRRLRSNFWRSLPKIGGHDAR